VDLQQTLESLGYNLIDRGEYFSTAALYRGGDNPHSLAVNKESGRCWDFVTCRGFDIEKIIKDAKIDQNSFYSGRKKNYIKMEKTYSDECLKRLLPHLDFYLNKGIDEKTLKEYKCGLATGGKLYQRVVFPIYNKNKKIHGFSGRLAIPKEGPPKWFHNGKTKDWFFPYYLNDDFQHNTEDKLYLVESIGDSIALTNAGFRNHLVSFGLHLSNEFIAKLQGLNKHIIFAFNNDVDSKRGRDGAIKGVMKLLPLSGFLRVGMVELPKNDFGDMTKQEIVDFMRREKSQEEMAKFIMAELKRMRKTSGGPKFSKECEKYEEMIDYYYG
jgi:hypothetical protein